MKEIQIYIHVSGGEMISESKDLKGQLGSPASNEKSTLPVSWDPSSTTKNQHFKSFGTPRQ